MHKPEETVLTMEQPLLEHRIQNQNCSGESDKGRTPERSEQMALAILAPQLEALKCSSLD